MKFICHRGKKNKEELENNKQTIILNLNLGYDCEVDVWKINDLFFLGHDGPEEEIEESFLLNDKLWCHAKNIEAYHHMIKKNFNTFWHQEDDYCLTSNKLIWVYPEKKLLENCIAVKPEIANYSLQDLKKCYAICTVEIERFKNLLDGEQE